MPEGTASGRLRLGLAELRDGLRETMSETYDRTSRNELAASESTSWLARSRSGRSIRTSSSPSRPTSTTAISRTKHSASCWVLIAPLPSSSSSCRARSSGTASWPASARAGKPGPRGRSVSTSVGPPRWFDWSSVSLWRGLAAAAAVIVLLVGLWNLSLQSQIATRDAALSAVADAISGGAPAYPVTGAAGTGYVIDTEGPGATFPGGRPG